MKFLAFLINGVQLLECLSQTHNFSPSTFDKRFELLSELPRYDGEIKWMEH